MLDLESVVARNLVGAVTVALVDVLGRETGGDVVGETSSHESADTRGGIVVDAGAADELKLLGRSPGRDLDHAAGRIAAEQSALQPLEDGDLLDVG